LIGDVPSATAILDRFLQHATNISITGESYRLRNRGKADQEARADQEGRRSTADGEGFSPPARDELGRVQDTARLSSPKSEPVMTVSSGSTGSPQAEGEDQPVAASPQVK
jgi:hypothetical protein